jgi:5-formaminoimidazole-4-carboxamide-1-(beta)-D-ribofuranosyl 5'-monophosphate synthetase
MNSWIEQPAVAVLGSHSALEICHGASLERLRSIVVTQRGRDETYSRYFRRRSRGSAEVGCVDDVMQLDRFADLLRAEVQEDLRARPAVFVPHRSFEVYLNSDYEAIEERFDVPIFGNRYMLRIEERGKHPSQYDLLERAGIPFPRQYTNPQNIDSLCLVKVLEAERGFERGFFFADSPEDYERQVEVRLRSGTITEEAVRESVIEQYVVGVQVNFNYFYSPLHRELELVGTDTRRQTNHEGLIRLPASLQAQALERLPLKFEEAGHMAVTVLESLLGPAFELGERFVEAAADMMPPGIIGPFALQTIVTPGPPRKEIIVIDVSPRMPGSPGITASPYSSYLYGHPVSMGRRIAMEIREAVEADCLGRLVT